MTEKRFTETVSTGIVTDTLTGKEYNCDVRIDEDLLDFLNQLHMDNENNKRILYDFMFILKQLIRDPNNQKTIHVAIDMLQNMGVEF